MNHSIHSADRSTHLKIVVVCARRRLFAVGWFRHRRQDQFGLRPDRSCR